MTIGVLDFESKEIVFWSNDIASILGISLPTLVSPLILVTDSRLIKPKDMNAAKTKNIKQIHKKTKMIFNFDLEVEKFSINFIIPQKIRHP